MTAARILVVGRSGQVASALLAAKWPDDVEIEGRGRDRLDLLNPADARLAVIEGNWTAVVNAAAYTQVDCAEERHQQAFALNRDGPAALAEGCAQAGIPLIHLSTDYVFDGTKAGAYVEDDPTNPLSVYGASKLAGEIAVRVRLSRHVILRTAWVFGPTGRNFVRSMLRIAEKKSALEIVDDQRGCPTAAADVAAAIVQIVMALRQGKSDGFGTWHLVNAGPTNWFDFACEVFRQANLRGFRFRPRITPVPSRAYPTRARRPMNSVLDAGRIARGYGISARRWQEALGETLDVLIGPATKATAN